MSSMEFRDFRKYLLITLISLMMLFTAFARINVVPVKAYEFTLVATETQNPYWGLYGGYHAIWASIKNDLAAIGINLELRQYSDYDWYDRVWGSGWDKSWAEGGWDMFINEWRLQPHGLDPWFTSMVRSDLTPAEGGYNIAPWRNRKADYLLRDGMTEFNATTRKMYLDAWQEEFMKDPPWINLYYAKVYEVMGRYITGYEPSATGFYDTAHLTLNNTMLYEARPDRDPNTIIYAISEYLGGLSPMFMDTYTDEQQSTLQWRTLYKWSCDPFPTDGSIPSWENYTIKPDMAADFPTYLNNDQTVRVTLREGMVWRYNNGTTVPITADDVVWTFTTVLDPQAKATGRGDFAHMIKNVTKVDNLTVDFNLKYAYPYAIVDSHLKYALYPDVLSILSNYRGGCILPKHKLASIPITQLDNHPSNTAFDDPAEWLPVSGPFMLDPANPPEPDVDITLIRNPSYYGYNGSIAGPIWMGYSLDGGANVTIYGNTTITRVPDGGHSIVVYADDNTGNIDASNTVHFTVMAPPVICILSPENKTYTVENVPLTFNVNEPTSWIGYSLDGQPNVTITGNTILTSLSDGGHSIVVYANDTMGNMGASNTVYFTVMAPPVISVLSPENKTYAVEDVPLTFTVNEATSWMGYSLDGGANVTITGNTTLTGLSDGGHYTTVYANDTMGNMGASNTVYFTVDTTSKVVYANDNTGNMGASSTVYSTVDGSSPTISILSPENKAYATENVPLTFTVKEPTSGWGPYNIDKFILQWIRDPAARLTALINNDVDFGDYPTAPVQTFKDLNNTVTYPYLRVVQYNRSASTPIWLNFNNEYLSNRYIRMAIANAINYPAIITMLLPPWGIETAIRGKTPILPQHYYTYKNNIPCMPGTETTVQLFNTALSPYVQNVTKAQAYMDRWKKSQVGSTGTTYPGGEYLEGAAGDADFSGKVDLDDFYIWRDEGWPLVPPATVEFLPGQDKDPDFNNDGSYDLLPDYPIWYDETYGKNYFP